MNRIIVNADDFGLNEHCSKAIAETFEKELVTDTTMMATGEYFDEAVALAKERGFIDKIGIHLNLTEGVPLTSEIKQCPRFVTDGRFNKQYDRTKRLTPEEKDAIYKELTAQVRKRCRQRASPSPMPDSHHHIHTGYLSRRSRCRFVRNTGSARSGSTAIWDRFRSSSDWSKTAIING